MKPTAPQGLSRSSCHCVIVALEVLPANEPVHAAQPSKECVAIAICCIFQPHTPTQDTFCLGSYFSICIIETSAKKTKIVQN